MLQLFKNLSEDQANSYGLVLTSSGISHWVRKGDSGWEVWVDDGEYEEAMNTIEQYLEENQDFYPTDEPLFHEYQKTFTGLWAAAILLVCHVAVTMGNHSQAFIRAYGSSAFHILRGQLYRTVTSLMLHANPLHLAGNIVGIALFGTAVCTVTGWGVGWLMILMTGILGNLANALLYQSGHLSVGASTAVFGAIGILAVQQFFKKLRLPGQRLKAWIPLGGGLALLGILGSGQYADLMAHLFGFLAGTVLGAIYAVFVKRPAARSYQACCLLIALSVLVMSWMRALGYIGQG
jgi:membrane associated rhomboid family serine protease